MSSKPATAVRQKINRYLEALLALDRAVLEALSRGASLGAVLDVLSRRIEEQSGLLCSILLLDSTGTQLRHGAAPSLPPTYCQAIDGATIGPRAGSCGTAAYLGKPVIVTNIATDPLWTDYANLALQHGLRACWSTPIISRTGKVQGTFALYYRTPRTPTRRELHFIEHATRLAGIVIEHDSTKTALNESEHRYRRLVENIPEVAWRADEQGNALFVGEKITSVFGYTPAEILKEGADLWFGRMSPDDRDRVEEAYQGLFKENRPFDVEYRIQHRDGHWMWWHDRAIMVDQTEGRRYADGLLSDITERKELEAQLLQSQKIEAVGQLAGGIAHDFNNLLGVILGHSDLLQQDVGDDTKAHNRAEAIQQAARRAASLTQQLLAFSRKQMLEFRVFNLNETVSGMHQMLSRVIGENIELVTRLSDAPANIKADPGQLEQVLMNLAVNARDAMPEGGKLVIETSRVELDDTYVRQHRGSVPGRYLLLTVSDTGLGMDAATVRRIFEPFFTTKERGRGTGLDLAMVYGIIKQSGGYISVYSEPNRGTTFRIYLPAHEGLEKAAVEEPLAEPQGGTETVLVVEDEKALRELTCVLLESFGYHVLEAADTQHAFEVAEAFDGTIHLLLTDVIMPYASGRLLAERLATLRPEIKVVFMTGYTDDVVIHNKLLENGVYLLRKPFTRMDLAKIIRTALDYKEPAALARV